MSGKIYLVGTPIGNMGDLSERGKQILGRVDFVCAEDTRVSGKLLMMLGIEKQLVSCHQHSHNEVFGRIIERVEAGESCAIVTDAGMPCISDPGELLVRMAAEHSLDVIAIPGPTALISGLALSGMDTQRFVFEGFLPVDGRRRLERLGEIRLERRTIILYEAPHKLENTLRDLASTLGDGRRVALCRELTKLHEEVVRCSLAEALTLFADKKPRGEFVIVLEGDSTDNISEKVWSIDDAVEMAVGLIESGEKPSDAAKTAALRTGITKREIYLKVSRINN